MFDEGRVRHTKVLVVDDLEANLNLLRRLLVTEGYDVATETRGNRVCQVVHDERPDVILLDVVMPDRSGLELCRQLKSDPTTRLIPVVLITGGGAARIEGIRAGADEFLSKPFDAQELKARVRSLVRLKRYTDELESAESVVVGLALTIEARDPYTQGHCERLARYSLMLGQHVGLDEADLTALYRGGFLHDVGKIAVPDRILLKPAALTVEEYDTIKQHTILGDRFCTELRSLRHVRPIVRHHHERLDGSGYPDGLKSDEVPLLAQIAGTADVFDALTTDRPYRRAVSREQAYEELKDEARSGWRQRDLVDALIDLSETGRLYRPAEVSIPSSTAAFEEASQLHLPLSNDPTEAS
jgi:putative two-component system response regulator